MSLPEWWEPLLARLRMAEIGDFTRLPAPADGARDSAVLVLLGQGEAAGAAGDGGDGGGTGADGPDVLVLQRAATLRNHAGQPAFPGGAADPGDRDAADTALREAAEEVGLDRASVEVVACLPRLWIPVSNYAVTPVLAWWREPHEVRPLDRREVARVARLPIAELADPEHRLQVRHPSGWVGPAFRCRGMLVWGFTAGVLSALLDLAGWTRAWPEDRVEDLPVAQDHPLADAAGEPHAQGAVAGSPPVP